MSKEGNKKTIGTRLRESVNEEIDIMKRGIISLAVKMVESRMSM
jgi:hypothetical protein